MSMTLSPGVGITMLIIGMAPMATMAYWLYWEPLYRPYDEDKYFENLQKYEHDIHHRQIARYHEIVARCPSDTILSIKETAVINARSAPVCQDLLANYLSRNKEL